MSSPLFFGRKAPKLRIAPHVTGQQFKTGDGNSRQEMAEHVCAFFSISKEVLGLSHDFQCLREHSKFSLDSKQVGFFLRCFKRKIQFGVAYHRVSSVFWMNILEGPISLGGGFKHFLFSPLPGEMIQFD